MLEDAELNIFIQAAQAPFPLESSYWRQKNIRAKAKFLSCPCFGKRQSPVQQRFLWRGNPWRRLCGSINLEKCDLRKQIGKTCFANSWSQALRSKMILRLLCVAPEHDANSISPCFLSCLSTVQEAAFLLRYRSPLWGSEMRGCPR